MVAEPETLTWLKLALNGGGIAAVLVIVLWFLRFLREERQDRMGERQQHMTVMEAYCKTINEMVDQCRAANGRRRR